MGVNMKVNIRCGICKSKMAEWRGERELDKMMKFLKRIQQVHDSGKLASIHRCGIGALMFYDVYR